MKKLVLGLVVLFLLQCFAVRAEEEKDWQMSAGVCSLFRVDLFGGQVVEGRGTALWIDCLKPLPWKLSGHEINTVLLLQAREEDFLCGASLQIEGITFWQSEDERFRAGLDPYALLNTSMLFRDQNLEVEWGGSLNVGIKF